MTLDIIKHRDILGFVLNELKLTGEMAEIGVRRGDFTKSVLSVWTGQKYHAIDPWVVQEPDVYREEQENQATQEAHLQAVQDIKDVRLNIIRALSTEAEKRFELSSLDCVYLDGNHSYAAVLDDINAWWHKVKIGGILGGHDFENNTENGNWIEVEKAVMRWTKEHGKVFYVSPCGSWWIHKTSP